MEVASPQRLLQLKTLENGRASARTLFLYSSWIPDLGISWHTVSLGVGTGENADSLLVYFLRKLLAKLPFCTSSGLLIIKYLTKGLLYPTLLLAKVLQNVVCNEIQSLLTF